MHLPKKSITTTTVNKHQGGKLVIDFKGKKSDDVRKEQRKALLKYIQTATQSAAQVKLEYLDVSQVLQGNSTGFICTHCCL